VATEAHRRTVLVVDDDASYREALSAGLKGEGFAVLLAADARTALYIFASAKPDVVLLDLRLPDQPGSEVCREMRRDSDAPIIMLSAVAEELDIVLCFELGADDYVPKPFRLRELVARIDAALRHRERARKAEGRPREFPVAVQVGPFRIDFVGRTVEIHGQRVELSRKEFDLLAHLATTPGRVCTREELMDEVWGTETADDRTLDTHMYRLRTKLEKDSAHPKWIVTVRGVGFLLNDGLRGVRADAGDETDGAAQPNRPLT
jgi:two-component system response regulator RegX3